MKSLSVFLLLLILALPSFATVDPDPDQIGVYFDENADIACTDMPMSTPFWAYVIITRPTSPEIHGVEFSLCTAVEPGYEGMVFRLDAMWAGGGIDINPVIIDLCSDGAIRGFVEPIVPQQDNALLLSQQFMLLAPITLDFHLGPYPVPTFDNGLPAYQGANGEIIPLGVSSGDPDLPVASVNGCNAVPVESADFGMVKALYR